MRKEEKKIINENRKNPVSILYRFIKIYILIVCTLLLLFINLIYIYFENLF